MHTVVKRFKAEVHGKTHQVLLTLPAHLAGDVQEAMALIHEVDKYWDTFWDGNEYDAIYPWENPRLSRVVTG